ncbi:DUF4424 domain-containing protein [Xanthobacteraceae bacterium Astr-EGSB]|uniref:DUF4424 domain-containing protein n=1 Tax=Astrobacterium formosum TaxID=3069710 RepID=UPI0027B02521|nr:DUF4424 domain-containing protein [Xanthobacteraceae bacterium Astr-EGSB]
MRTSTLALIIIACGSPPALANDSSAELATGGLVFVKNDAIEMRSEDLFISAAEIRVRYRFHNRTDRDVTVQVAFPLPEIKVDHEDVNISVPTEDPVNLVGFATSADGRPVRAEVEQRVFARGVERTDMLKGLGIPLAPHLVATNEALDRLPKARWREFIDLGLAEISEYDIGKGMEKHLAARWALRTTFHWRQIFRAGAETVIDHSYKPSVGASVQTALGSPGFAKEPWFADYQQKYCIDRDFLAAVERARRSGKSDWGAPMAEERIDYVLTTGANWSGPIRDFRLVVDKGDPSSLVSFCAEGVRKIAPTRFELRRTDFVPRRDLSVLILKRMAQ